MAAPRTEYILIDHENIHSLDPERVINHLVRIAKARPRKRKTLASNLASLFGKQVGAHEVAAVIAALEAAGKLVIDEKDVVSYRL